MRSERHTSSAASVHPAFGGRNAPAGGKDTAALLDVADESESLADGAAPHPQGPEWQLALRIAADSRFAKSDLLRNFLLYICERTLTGQAAEITEQRIGTHIFHRPADYNPGEDNIVRSYARTLRKRLESYFEEEGAHEPIRVTVPRGGYVPIFEVSAEAQALEVVEAVPGNIPEAIDSYLSPASYSTEPLPNPATIVADARNHRRRRLQLWAAIVACMVSIPAVWLGLRSHRAQTPTEPAHLLWQQMFEARRGTLIVPADSGLGILQNLTGHLVSLEDYASGKYRQDLDHLPSGIGAANLDDLSQQRYTSVVDLKVTGMVTALAESAAGHTEVRYARSVTLDDLKNSNVILLGSSHTNPWVSLFEDKTNFRLLYLPQTNRSLVHNEHPLAAERPEYWNSADAPGNRTYGVVDYLPSLNGTAHVLIIQGLNMAATQAAADTLFDAPAMQPIMLQATLPNGTLRPFELLIETSSIGASDPEAHVIATRFY